MRVRLDRFLSVLGDKNGIETETGPGGLRRGIEYLVLSFVNDPNPAHGIMAARFLLLDDNGEPQWNPTAMFSVVSGHIPEGWRARTNAHGELEFAPAAWLDDGFWGRFHGEGKDLVAEAQETFRREVAAMQVEDRQAGDELTIP